MRKLYAQNELGFFFILLAVYLLLQNLGYRLSGLLGCDSAGTALLNLGFSLYLFFWLRREGLLGYYGLGKLRVPLKELLWLIPLVLLSTNNLWLGIHLPLSASLLPGLVSMACVGFLEELLMRGFLFRALAKDSLKLAVIVTSLTFGAGHLLNLFSAEGMALVDNVLQIITAMGIGLLYAVLLLRSGSLWPCIVSHSAIDVLYLVSRHAETAGQHLLLSGGSLLLMLGYTWYLLRTAPKNC